MINRFLQTNGSSNNRQSKMRRYHVLFIFMSIICLMSGCSTSKETGTGTDGGNDKMLPVNETNDGILIDDILYCKDMLGKTPEEAVFWEKHFQIMLFITF